VTFQAKDYREVGKPKRIRLPAEEFFRRWLQHVLPRGLVRVRSYGLLGNRQWKVALSRLWLMWLGWWCAVVGEGEVVWLERGWEGDSS